MDEILFSGCATISSCLNVALKETQDSIALLKIGLRRYFIQKTWDEIALNDERFNKLRTTLALIRQREKFLQDIDTTLSRVKCEIEIDLKSFRSHLYAIHKTVICRMAVPTESIFVGYCLTL